jgi:hypothetical protein
MAGALALSGCAGVEAQMSVAHGMMRAEPHPEHADSLRVTTIASPILMDPLARGTPAGVRNSVVALLGERCASAEIIEEGRVRYGSGREDVVVRVICPAARGG